MNRFSPLSTPMVALAAGGQQVVADLEQRWRRSLGLALMGLLGITLTGAIVPLASVQAEPLTAEAEAAPLIGDGVYFYGQAPEPDTLGSGYLVFEAQGERVVGAIYMPFSSFDCFQGQLTGNDLALQITNSYTQETYNYAIALEPVDAIANGNGGVAPLSLAGFHNLGAAGESELELLQTCKGVLAPEAEVEI